MIDGHLRAYFGTRDLQKTHVARLHMAARATAETWVADADGQPGQAPFVRGRAGRSATAASWTAGAATSGSAGWGH